MPDFLLEIGTEEIPDWMIEGALTDLRGKFRSQFTELGGDALRTEGTPRRLVLMAQGLQAQTPDVRNMALGPYVSAGEKAAEGFARKNGTTVAALERTADAKGERYLAYQLVKGRSALELLSEHLPGIIGSISFPKAMYWTGRGGTRFIRPIRWLMALLDSTIVPFEVAGVHAGSTTRGHRVLGAAGPIAVTVGDYEARLRENFVVVNGDERRARIEAGLGANVHHDAELLATLVNLTEYPSVIHGSFDEDFLTLPREILTTVMRHHQRYFSVLAADGRLAPEFFAVTNTDGDPDGLIRHGNERVLRARFNDARFFWDADQRRPLASRLEDLAKVTFQASLGTYQDKTDRVVALAQALAFEMGANEAVVQRAASLLKCDLTTDMVKEFTELQGIVGGLYARAQGESDAVADAIYDHYKPTSMDDTIPRTLDGQVVALADKLDTLRQCFGIGLIPTGSRDPFALRRAAQGVVKILFEAQLDIPILRFVNDVPGLPEFLRERIDFYLRDVRNYAYDEVSAAMAAPLGSLHDLAERVDALHYVRPTEDFVPLAASFKRIRNILAKATDGSATLDEALLTPGPEADLFRAFTRVRDEASRAPGYREKLSTIATLRPTVDLFFDKILVNDSNPAIRMNRLALLQGLLTEFSSIADFSEIVSEGVRA